MDRIVQDSPWWWRQGIWKVLKKKNFTLPVQTTIGGMNLWWRYLAGVLSTSSVWILFRSFDNKFQESILNIWVSTWRSKQEEETNPSQFHPSHYWHIFCFHHPVLWRWRTNLQIPTSTYHMRHDGGFCCSIIRFRFGFGLGTEITPGSCTTLIPREI